MSYLILIAFTLVLFAGFVFLTRFEARRGGRFFADRRGAFDARVERWEFIVTHVDFPAFLRDTVRAGAERLVHDVAHGVLILVRLVERLLTRAVRAMRTRRAMEFVEEGERSASAFAAKMREFREELNNSRGSSAG